MVHVYRFAAVLESQLAEQQIFFEKRLAQETVRALENSLNQRNSTASSSSSAKDEEIGSSSIGDHDFNSITAEKIELSAIEYEYGQILSEISSTEASIRKQKKVLTLFVTQLLLTSSLSFSDAYCLCLYDAG